MSAVDKSRRRPKAGGLERRRVPPPRCLRGLPTPKQNTQAAPFALDQAARMLCFVSPALAGSSFTYAEHPGNLIPMIGYSSSSLSSKNQVDTSEQQGGGTCQSEVKKEAEGRVTRTAACDPALLRSHPLRCLGTTQPEAECCREFRNSQ